jgi:hypothetical protein
VLFGSPSTRDRRHLARIHRSWRSVRRLAEHSYEGPRVEKAWQEVKDLHSWPAVGKLSLIERLLLSGSVIPKEGAGRPTWIDLTSFPFVAVFVVLMGALLLAGSQFGPTIGAQVEVGWRAFLEGNQAPTTARAPEAAPIVVPTSTATPTRTPTHTPISTPSPIPTPTAEPTLAGPAPTSPTPEPPPTQTPEPPPTPPPTATPAGRKARSVIEGVIRSQPHHTSSRVGRLPVGATVDVIQIVRGSAPFPPENRWIEIRMGDLQGYVYWSLLDLPD